MYHESNGLYFERLDDGAVRVLKKKDAYERGYTEGKQEGRNEI